MAQGSRVGETDRATDLIEQTRRPSIRHGIDASADRTTGRCRLITPYGVYCKCILQLSSYRRLVIAKYSLALRSLTWLCHGIHTMNICDVISAWNKSAWKNCRSEQLVTHSRVQAYFMAPCEIDCPEAQQRRTWFRMEVALLPYRTLRRCGPTYYAQSVYRYTV